MLSDSDLLGGGGREGAGGWTLEAKDFMGWINSKGL